MPRQTLVVSEQSKGQRLDLFVGEALGLSRTRLKTLFEAGAVAVNGRKAKKGDRVQPAQRVDVDVEEELPEAPVASADVPLVVLFEDEHLVALNKPSGSPAHPLKPGETGTLVNALVARYPECAEASEEPREGGLCHRLDVETSGVILAARTRSAWTAMREQFGGREIDKRYWALVAGPLADDGEIDLPLRHDPRHAERMQTALDGEGGARDARSSFRVLERQGTYAWVEVKIETGVHHQVRAHLAAIGASIVGDANYGGIPHPGLNRFFLHARSLGFKHPVTGQAVHIECPLPQDLQRALQELGFSSPAAA
jgi:23S rRNA pseudouridine1911/1915/1917 synthase